MASLGLDTSIVVRFLVGEPAPLAEKARLRVEKALHDGCDLVVSDLVVAEAYYVLHKVYGIPKRASIKALIELFDQPGFRPEKDGKALQDVLDATGKRPGMVDRMIHAQYMDECASMITFEKAAKKFGNTEIL